MGPATTDALAEKDREAVGRAFRYAIEAFEMVDTSEEEPGPAAGSADSPEKSIVLDKSTALDKEIHDYVVANRSDVSSLLGEDDPAKRMASPHYLRLTEMGFRAMLLRGRVTAEEIAADKKRMLDDLDSFKPGEGDLDDEQMRDWMDVQKALAMRFAGEIEPEEIAKEINRDYELAERLAPVVRKMMHMGERKANATVKNNPAA